MADETVLFGRFNSALASIGASFTIYYAVRVLLFLVKSFKMFGLRLGANPKKYGSWSVVTGATDGIGKAYAEQLAAKGLNVVLMSRTESKLDAVASEIASKYNVQTKVIAVDFTSGSEIYENIGQQLDGLEIGVLVNNVGMSYPYPLYFHELEDPEKATMMTYLIVPSMLSRKKGLIINIASAAGSLPTPLLTVYSSTKSYLDFFSRALNVEYSSKGLIVQLSKIRRSSFTVPTATSYVKSALATVGNETRTFGCFVHNLQGSVLSNLPEFVSDFVQMAILGAARKRMMKLAKETSKTN
ncbi:putative estradiol 17-beta-dehydrogenase 12-B-like [Apostichopus japonicus]|uniref:Putative estradiol 17-beta-dehydrogenase 12-B-like n=1 Tax=Stichopus japonicus TaxID=307972 RepID=A0A2G8LQ96_STIJA|nr:putative estradiol 17-beta-dehydrogenase 12-B-like [Apostichopus japonicus]